MPSAIFVTRRCGLIVLAVCIVLIIALVASGYHRTLHEKIQGGGESVDALPAMTALTSGGGGGSGVEHAPLTWRQPSDVKVYRFNNGRVSVSESLYSMSEWQQVKLSPAKLESLFENIVMETTADCTTARRFGYKADGRGWDLCIVGPLPPQEPCIVFSFGAKKTWEFEDQIAAAFKCQVLAVDPKLSKQSHMRSERVVALKEGLFSSKSTVDSAPVDSFLGFLKRFKADNFIIDIVKINVGASELASLETAVGDGSMKNVKQLLLATQISKDGTEKDFYRYLAIFKALHTLGFRQWRHKWNTDGSFQSTLNKNLVRSCCNELYFINVNFLNGKRRARNPSGTRVDAPLVIYGAAKITKAPGYDQADKIINIDLTGKSRAELERIYFGIAEQVHLKCPYNLRLGNTGDGGYNMCFTKPFDFPESKPSCVAFSFGINYVWGYDDLLVDKYKCKVYMFDPSMTKVNDHQRKNSSWFYRVGLSSENKVEANGWKMKTLCTFFEELGYGDKIIDILKIDIENWEWVSIEKALKDGCLKNVKQFNFESHTNELIGQKSDYTKFINIWREIYKQGFRSWKFFHNPLSRYYPAASKPPDNRPCCYDQYLLNTKFIEL